ncbi:MAG: 3-methyl-2-oxobutanoate hydroxymethyltransferase [Chloroflexota bacterium]|jgi:3-methyl-2-oxobutanoate hydroxymethyltransferase
MADQAKVTVGQLVEMKRRGEKISMITCYDYPNALLVDRSGMDIVLVGDSLGMTVLGYPNTLPVTMTEMIVFAKAVTRACKRAFVIGDMPYMAYQPSVELAVMNAGRFMAEASCDGIKLEGGKAMADRVRAIVDAGIPVMGHLGLTPQSASMQGGFKVQARTSDAAKRLLDDCYALEEAGVYSILLELVPAKVAEYITGKLSVPTISIGSGPGCDGHCMIYHDVIGMFEAFLPRHVKQYCNVSPIIQEALNTMVKEIRDKLYPEPGKHDFKISEEAFQEFLKGVE